MPDQNTAARAGFQNAEAYERFMGRWSRRLAPLLVRFGGLSDGDRVLDVGCGTGSLTFALAETANLVAVTGLDLTPAFLDFARARSTDPRIAFRPGDARQLPFGDNSFDRAFRCSSCISSPTRRAPSRKCAGSCGRAALSPPRYGI